MGKPFNLSLKDHPRMRGEQLKTSLKHENARGSSPHARGAVPIYQAARAIVGIIPACAGSRIGRP